MKEDLTNLIRALLLLVEALEGGVGEEIERATELVEIALKRID